MCFRAGLSTGSGLKNQLENALSQFRYRCLAVQDLTGGQVDRGDARGLLGQGIDDGLGGGEPDAGDLGDLFRARRPDPLEGAEVPKERTRALRTARSRRSRPSSSTS